LELRAFLAAGITLIVGVDLTALAYQGAVSHAKVYGVLIRSAVDTYRFDLLKAIHQSMPLDLAEEKKLWNTLMRWLYLNE
jgi:nitric oxide synthase oxygenase domain/subunit